jgi:hypothetical protein
MTVHEWQAQWARLDQFRVSGERDQVSAEWFAQLKHHHVDVVDYGITRLIGQAKDTFLPGLGLLKDFIQQKFDRYDRTHGKCVSCGGSGWLEAPPFKSNGLIYSNVLSRCGACGIPEPKIDGQGRRESLTSVEAHEYHAGRYGRDQMPEALKVRPGSRSFNTELVAQLQAWFRRVTGRGEAA